jgi:hypothetical protein
MLLLLITLGVASTGTRAHAQVTTRFSVAAGPATTTSPTIGGSSHGWAGDAALWLSFPGMPVGLRADAGIFRFAEHRLDIRCIMAPCPEISYRDAGGLGTLSLTFSLTRTRVAPYLLGGAGVYRIATTETRLVSRCPPDAMCIAILPPQISATHTATTSIGTAVGAGLAARVGRLNLLAEGRYHSYSHPAGSGHIVPFTLGVRF